MIILSNNGESWVADFVDDAEVFDLFGTTKLTTAYTAAAPADEVLAGIRALNPGCRVEVAA